MTIASITEFSAGARPTRQARSAATRRRILDAAIDAFTVDGIGAVSLRDIAARAGVTHPGLLRHYSSKDALLGAVVERLDQTNADWLAHELGPQDVLGFASLARHNAASPGYLELYTALSGEATSATHPAHAHMRERYARVRSAISQQLATVSVRPGIEPHVHATLAIAGWDGMQLQERYAPDEIDLVAYVGRQEQWLLGRSIPLDPDEHTAPSERLDDLEAEIVEEPDLSGGASARKELIVSSATELFARDGFHGTSLRDIAERSGISKSTLLHHIGSKDQLLIAVLHRRDRLTTAEHLMPRGAAVDRLYALADSAEHTGRGAPGLIELYAVLSCEGSIPGHPAHDFFARRFRVGRRYFTTLFRTLRDEGSLRPDREPRHEAAWLMATWDGLQIQWLYDPSIDVAQHLRAHFADLLEPR
ncbi:hypothetical protein ASD65_04125 [Microbacterium sp. Root61]|uniref:TetR/AcrR family transcriptional regulator n=1 Tax=Microbacterium sp. Root61 TaxID=1736570 RepID=UPI0006FE6650|nr:TetR/AcrR family transcriptional regulator [Microbacterium sp. Root61]KRA23704.1 hypothetical protein ASD65_04125 [Microbacterium sp. Root61]